MRLFDVRKGLLQVLRRQHHQLGHFSKDNHGTRRDVIRGGERIMCSKRGGGKCKMFL